MELHAKLKILFVGKVRGSEKTHRKNTFLKFELRVCFVTVHRFRGSPFRVHWESEHLFREFWTVLHRSL